MIRKLAGLALLAGVLLAGCQNGMNPPAEPPLGDGLEGDAQDRFEGFQCEPGCIDNEDARRMYSSFGLRQLTNITRVNDLPGYIGNPYVEGGIATWYEQQIGMKMVHIPTLRDHEFAKQANLTSQIILPHECCALVSWVPRQGDQEDLNSSVVKLWFADGRFEEVPSPAGSRYVSTEGAFDYPWALLLNRSKDPSMADGTTALHVRTGKHWDVYPVQPRGGRYGTNQFGRTVQDGRAVLGFIDEPVPHQALLKLYDLENGTSQDLFTLEGYFTRFDSSDQYLLVPSASETTSNVWVYDWARETWDDLRPKIGGRVIEPVLGGNWLVYYDPSHYGSLNAWHIPTGAKHELMRFDRDAKIISWDADPQHLLVYVELGYDTGNARYPGTQVYWKPMPEEPISP